MCVWWDLVSSFPCLRAVTVQLGRGVQQGWAWHSSVGFSGLCASLSLSPPPFGIQCAWHLCLVCTLSRGPQEALNAPAWGRGCGGAEALGGVTLPPACTAQLRTSLGHG